ncbi:hypothetical protein BH686_18955 [Rhodococcus erythropolis]|nr:hypothetical protein BH686_18955 [Rhodococcus erythropolis]
MGDAQLLSLHWGYWMIAVRLLQVLRLRNIPLAVRVLPFLRFWLDALLRRFFRRRLLGGIELTLSAQRIPANLELFVALRLL